MEITLSFEEAMGELETIVKRLEEGRIPLEEAMTAFERGHSLRQHCEQKLRQAKLRLAQVQMTPEGAVVRDDVA